jgi:LysM repeat protein
VLRSLFSSTGLLVSLVLLVAAPGLALPGHTKERQTSRTQPLTAAKIRPVARSSTPATSAKLEKAGSGPAALGRARIPRDVKSPEPKTSATTAAARAKPTPPTQARPAGPSPKLPVAKVGVPPASPALKRLARKEDTVGKALPTSKPSAVKDAVNASEGPARVTTKSAAVSAAVSPALASPRVVPPPRPVFAPGELQKLGSLSVGKPNTGYLVNAVPMPAHPDWVLSVPDHRFGTAETVSQLQHCLHQVHAEFPGSPRVVLGSLSAQFGGGLPPHKSHRTGRDVDVYFFRKVDAAWNRNARREDIDLPRTWALLKCFVSETDVDMVLVDHVVQGWLEEYALSIDEPADWVHGLFHDQSRSCCAPVRHVPGHGAHMHVRFSSPNARQRAVQNYDRLVAAGVVPRKVAPVQHTVAKGDTLIGIARRYHVTVDALKANNALTGSLLRLGQQVAVQQAVDLEGAKDAVWVPPRHVVSSRIAPGRRIRERSAAEVAAASESQRVLAAEELEDEVTAQGAVPSSAEPEIPAQSLPLPIPGVPGPTAQRATRSVSVLALRDATNR